MHTVIARPDEAWVLDDEAEMVCACYGQDRLVVAHWIADRLNALDEARPPAEDEIPQTLRFAGPILAAIGLIALGLYVAWRVTGGDF